MRGVSENQSCCIANGKNKKLGVVAVIRESNKFLLIKRSDYVEAANGYWCPVSGRVEEGETEQEALKREVMEEFGFEVEAYIKIKQTPSFDNKFTLSFWTTKNHSGEARIASDEISDIKWVTIEEMDTLSPMFEDDIEIMKTVANTKND